MERRSYGSRICHSCGKLLQSRRAGWTCYTCRAKNREPDMPITKAERLIKESDRRAWNLPDRPYALSPCPDCGSKMELDVESHTRYCLNERCGAVL